MTIDLMTLLAQSCLPEPDTYPWPVHGHAYPVIIDVERVYYQDEHPHYAVIHYPKELGEIFCQHQLEDLVGDEELPIASGLFSCTLTYWHEHHTEWETGTDDSDYGFEVSHLHKLPDHP